MIHTLCRKVQCFFTTAIKKLSNPGCLSLRCFIIEDERGKNISSFVRKLGEICCARTDRTGSFVKTMKNSKKHSNFVKMTWMKILEENNFFLV